MILHFTISTSHSGVQFLIPHFMLTLISHLVNTLHPVFSVEKSITLFPFGGIIGLRKGGAVLVFPRFEKELPEFSDRRPLHPNVRVPQGNFPAPPPCSP